MPRVCKVCDHPCLEEIDMLLVRGDSIAEIARKYAISDDSLRRHQENHLPATMVPSASAVEVTRADKLLSQVDVYKNEINELKDLAIENGDINLALKAIDRALRCIELQSKVAGIITERPVINIIQSPQWVALRTKILYVLDDHPAAKTALMAALDGA